MFFQSNLRQAGQPAVLTVVNRLCNVDLPPRVVQYHCDWHAGEEMQRVCFLPSHGRLAQFVGAPDRPKQPASLMRR